MKTKLFSIRVPEDLVAQIDLRAQLNHRSRNGEIVNMMKRYIEYMAEQDLMATEARPSPAKLE